jgi:hypothetical protein
MNYPDRPRIFDRPVFEWMDGLRRRLGAKQHAEKNTQRLDVEEPAWGGRGRRLIQKIGFYFMTSLSATDAPFRDLLMSAASMKAMISKVSFGSTGGTPVRKNLAISTSSGP